MKWATILNGFNQGIMNGQQFRANMAQERDRAFIAPWANANTIAKHNAEMQIMPYATADQISQHQQATELRPYQTANTLDEIRYLQAARPYTYRKIQRDDDAADSLHPYLKQQNILESMYKANRIPYDFAQLHYDTLGKVQAWAEQQAAHPLVMQRIKNMHLQESAQMANRFADPNNPAQAAAAFTDMYNQYPQMAYPWATKHINTMADIYQNDPTRFYAPFSGSSSAAQNAVTIDNAQVTSYANELYPKPPSRSINYSDTQRSTADGALLFNTWDTGNAPTGTTAPAGTTAPVGTTAPAGAGTIPPVYRHYAPRTTAPTGSAATPAAPVPGDAYRTLQERSEQYIADQPVLDLYTDAMAGLGSAAGRWLIPGAEDDSVRGSLVRGMQGLFGSPTTTLPEAQPPRVSLSSPSFGVAARQKLQLLQDVYKYMRGADTPAETEKKQEAE